MSGFKILDKNKFFEVLGGLNVENRGDDKVAMLSEIDMSSVERLRMENMRVVGMKPSYTAFVAKAVSLALREQPYANRIAIELPFWKRIVQLNDVHMTVAVEKDSPEVEQAVYAGTIRHTDKLGLIAITRELQALAQATPETSERWRQFNWIVEKLPVWLARRLLSMPRWSPSLWIEHRGGAVMISSPAKYGVDIMVGAWPWPIGFSFGLVKQRPLAIDGEVVVRRTMMLTMSFDRRIMVGAPAARFFHTVCDHLENAERDMGAPASV